MRNRELVRTRHPNAWALESAQAGCWVVMDGRMPPERIGKGGTAKTAWADAAATVCKERQP